MCLILEECCFFLAMHFPCEIGTLEGYCGLETTACLARKINIIYISCSFLCIVLSWRTVGTVEANGRDLAKPRDVMNGFSHPRAWHEERPQRVTTLFSEVKNADHPPIAVISSTGRAPPCRIHTGRLSSSMKYFSARTQASCPGKLIFCILATSFMNILPALLNDMTTNYLSAIERNIFQDFFKSGQRMLCAFSFPISFPLLHYHVHIDSQLSLAPYIPMEQLTYATCGQPI